MKYPHSFDSNYRRALEEIYYNSDINNPHLTENIKT